MRAIDADELIETCKNQLQTLETWSRESGLNPEVLRKGYSMTIDLLRSADTLNVVTRHEYDRTISEYEFLLSNLRDAMPEISHVGYDDQQMGREK
jgi:hypothetical protein